MTLLAINKGLIENVAQWLESRCDPMHAAAELRIIVAGATPSEDPALTLLLYRALKNNGGHNCGLHKPRSCATCNATGAFEKSHPVKP